MFPIGGGEDTIERMAEVFGPAQIGHHIRQALQFCWMALPKGRRLVEEVEAQIRRIVERALRDFREDRQAFGHGDEA